MSYQPSSWLDRLLGACLTVLLGAVALFTAAHLIQAVWVTLLVILGVGTFISLSLLVLRSRRNNW